MKTLISCIFIAILFSCNAPAGKDGGSKTSTAAEMDLNRANPKTTPAVHYEEKVTNDLNNWFFKVDLFETAKRFNYRLALQFEEVTGEDEIRFPNLGMDPEPVIKKGSKQYECIIGFNDRDGVFHEYKKVSVVDGDLKVTTLKSYAVTVKE